MKKIAPLLLLLLAATAAPAQAPQQCPTGGCPNAPQKFIVPYYRADGGVVAAIHVNSPPDAPQCIPQQMAPTPRQPVRNLLRAVFGRR